MADLVNTIVGVLSADAALSALVDNFYTPDILGRFWVELDDITDGTPIIEPTIFVKPSSNSPMSVEALDAERWFFEVWYIDHNKFSLIGQARQRVLTLLDKTKVDITIPSNVYIYKIIYAGSLLGQIDDALSGAFVERDRFEVHLRRNT